MKPLVSKVIGCIAVSLLTAFSTVGALAESLSTVTSDKLVDVIRKAKIIKAEYPLSAVVDGSEARLTTLRSPLAKPQDLKIDSMLLAKTVMQAFPGQIMRLKAQFGNPDHDQIDEVTVTIGEVKAYGAGAMTENELMSTLELVTRHADTDTTAPSNTALSVKPGPAEETRTLIAIDIEKLRQKGTDVKPFEARLKQIEDSIGTADSAAIRSQSKDLMDRLKDVEGMIRDAGNIQHEPPMMHQRPSQPMGGQQMGAGGPSQEKAQPSRAYLNMWMQVRGAIRERKQAGQDVSDLNNGLREAGKFRTNGQTDQAEAVLRSLANRMGVQLKE